MKHLKSFEEKVNEFYLFGDKKINSKSNFKPSSKNIPFQNNTKSELYILAKNLTENNSKDIKILVDELDDFDKFCLNTCYNMNFELEKNYSDIDLFTNAIYKNYIEVIQYLIDKGSNLDMIIDKVGLNTPLIYACYLGKIDIVKLLLQQKDIDVNIKSLNGYTALMTAILHHKYDCVKILIDDPRIKLDITDDDGKTAIDLVKEISPVVRNKNTAERDKRGIQIRKLFKDKKLI